MLTCSEPPWALGQFGQLNIHHEMAVRDAFQPRMTKMKNPTAHLNLEISPLQDSLKIANPPLSRGASPGFDPATAATAEGCCLPKLNSGCSIAAALQRTGNWTVLSRRCLSPHCSGPSRHWAGWPMRADRRHSSAG